MQFPIEETDPTFDRVAHHLRPGLCRYINEGVQLGSFLEHVVSNNLRGAVSAADPLSALTLVPLVQWLRQYAPAQCWGSPQSYTAWITAHSEARSGERTTSTPSPHLEQARSMVGHVRKAIGGK